MNAMHCLLEAISSCFLLFGAMITSYSERLRRRVSPVQAWNRGMVFCFALVLTKVLQVCVCDEFSW